MSRIQGEQQVHYSHYNFKAVAGTAERVGFELCEV